MKTRLFLLIGRCTYRLTRFVILRLLGLIYLIAFLAAAKQIKPLIGKKGLLPVGHYLDQMRKVYGSKKEGIIRQPSLFWWNHSDKALISAAWLGVGLSACVFLGRTNAIIMTVLWLLYMSFVHVGQDWYEYGWETQLLETGFLAIFLCPLRSTSLFPKYPPPRIILLLFRWLIFRIMLGAGLIKIRCDSCWQDRTALYYHFETQPLPNPLSRWFHFLPKKILRAGVVFNHIAELIAPWLIFIPGMAKRLAGGTIIVFHGILILSGNLSFLNWLTIVPALACLDDAVWARTLPRSLVQSAQTAPETKLSFLSHIVLLTISGVIAFLSIKPVSNMFSRYQIMNTSFDPLNLVNTYGAFGVVGRERLNIVFEGTDSHAPDDDTDWKAYIYKGLPVDPDKMPPQIAPYQLRLDWQMWFAAMGNPAQYPWIFHLIWKLFHNDQGTLSLFASNPFPKNPPRYVRATLYKYSFAKSIDGRPSWWRRERVGIWLPPLCINNPDFIKFLRCAEWLDEEFVPLEIEKSSS